MTEARRKLTDMDFSKEGCHVSLVSKKVGGAANARVALVLKSLVNNEETMQEEMIAKAAHEEFVAKAVAEAIAPIQKSLDEAVAQIEVYKAAEVAAQEEVRKAKEESRKGKLAEVMGSESPELEAEFAILKSLEDAVFDIVLKAKKASVEALTKSEMFQEIGVGGEADTSKIEESAEMRIIKSMLK